MLYKVDYSTFLVYKLKSIIIRVKKKKVKYLFKNNRINLQSTFSSIMTYTNGFKYGSKLKIKRIIDRNFYS